jgi:hypothetical protein
MLSALSATMLSSPPCNLAFMAAGKYGEAQARDGFAERLLAAFRHAGRLRANGEPDRAWLAGRLEISVQALSQAITGKTVFSAYTTAKAAAALQVNAGWLATGEGSMEMSASERQGHLAQAEAELLRAWRVLPDEEQARVSREMSEAARRYETWVLREFERRGLAEAHQAPASQLAALADDEHEERGRRAELQRQRDQAHIDALEATLGVRRAPPPASPAKPDRQHPTPTAAPRRAKT